LRRRQRGRRRKRRTMRERRLWPWIDNEALPLGIPVKLACLFLTGPEERPSMATPLLEMIHGSARVLLIENVTSAPAPSM
jgi:hypothetical protein